MLLLHTFRLRPSPSLAVRLWDGQELRFAERPEFALTFRAPQTFRRCFASRDPAEFAEAYIQGRLDIEGDLWAATGLGSYLRTASLEPADTLRFAPKLRAAVSPHTPERDRRAVKAHYDLSDEFFRLFLDQKLVYSCAYFETPEQSLEQAQERKLELICNVRTPSKTAQSALIKCSWANPTGTAGFGVTSRASRCRVTQGQSHSSHNGSYRRRVLQGFTSRDPVEQ